MKERGRTAWMPWRRILLFSLFLHHSRDGHPLADIEAAVTCPSRVVAHNVRTPSATSASKLSADDRAIRLKVVMVSGEPSVDAGNF